MQQKCAFTLAEGTSYCTLLPTKVRFGFTLAEVLITLGIIGVVAAMTIPALMQNNYEKRTVTQIKETQSILSQAIRMAEEEYGDVAGWGILEVSKDVGSKMVAEKLKPFLKLAADCGTLDDKGICFFNGTYDHLNLLNKSSNYATYNESYKVRLLNGSSFSITVAGTPEIVKGQYIKFHVDTNGAKKPNTVGKDLFVFTYKNNGIYPEGTIGSFEEGHCGLNSSGYGCAYEVLKNNNMNYLHKK